MKTKTIIAILAAVVALSAIGVTALSLLAPGDAESTTALFHVMEADEAGSEFSMVSQDSGLVINITNNTTINFEDYLPKSDENDEVTKNARELLFGRTLAEVLDNRNLRVVHEGGQAIDITILFETAVAMPPDVTLEDGYIGIMTLPEYLSPGDLASFDDGDASYIEILPPIGEIASWDNYDQIILNGEIVVNNVILEGAPAPVLHEVVMVPLAPVAEALGYDVTSNDELQSIQLGVGIQVWVGETEAHVGRMAPIELSTAPVLVDGEVFVPLDFFRSVLGQTAYVFEGQVVVETYSDMH